MLRNIAWTNQDKPKPSAWTVWRRVLRQCVCSGDRLLRNLVGRWLEPIEEEDIDQWEWFCDTKIKALKQVRNGKWFQYIPTNQYPRARGDTQRYKEYKLVQESFDIDLLQQTTVHTINGMIAMEGCTGSLPLQQTVEVEIP